MISDNKAKKKWIIKPHHITLSFNFYQKKRELYNYDREKKLIQ